MVSTNMMSNFNYLITNNYNSFSNNNIFPYNLQNQANNLINNNE